ncbi:phosphatidylinositol 3-and 4-kinase domain-containing, partial [Cystoisospora suis]
SLPGPLSCIPGCRHGDSLHCWSSGNTSGNNATAGPAAFSDQARLCSKAALGGSLVSNHPSRAPGEGPNVSPARGPPRNRHDENQDEVLKNGDRGSGAPRKPTLGHSASGIQPKNGRWGFRESWYRFVSFFRSEKTPCGFVSSASPPTRRTSLRIQHGKESSQKEGLKIVDRVQVFSAPVLTAAGFIVREQLLLLGNVLSLSTRDRCFVSCTSASSGLYGRRSCSERGCTRAFLDSQNAGLEPQEGGKVSWFAASQTRSRGTPHDGGSGCPQQQEELDRKKRETRRLEADTEVLQQARACRNAAAEIWLLVARERACVALAAAAATGVENRPVGRDAPPSSGLLSVSWPPGRSQRLLLLRRAKLLSGDEPLLQLAACLSPWQLTMEDCGEPRLTTGEGTETETNSIAAQQERLLPFSVLHSGESQPKQQAVALLQKTLHAMLPRTSRPLARHLHLSAIWAAVASQQLFQRRAEHFCSCTVQAFATVSLASARTTLLSPEKGCPSEQVPLLVNRNLKDDVSLLAVEERIAAAAMDKWLQRLERGSFYASTVVECKESRPGVLDGHAAGGEQSALIFASVMGAGQAYILLLKFLQQLALLLCSLASPRGLSDSDFRAGNTRLTSVAKQQEHVVFGLLQRVFHVCPAVLHSADSVRALVETLTVIGEALHVVSGFATSQALLPPSGPSGVDVSAAASSSLPLAAGGIAGGKGSSVFPQAAGGMGGPPPTTDKAMQVLVNAIDGNLRRWVERLAQLVWLAACTLGSSGGGSSLLAHLFSLLLAKVALGRRESSSPNLLVRWFLPPPTSTGMSVSEASTRPRSIRLSGAAVPDSGAGFGVERGREGEKSASAGLPVATCALRPGKDGRRTSCNPLADLASVSPGFRGGNGVVAVSDFCGDIRSTSPLLSALPLCACYRCSEQDGSSRTFWVSPADSLCLPVRLTLSAGRWEEPALSSTIDPDAAKGVPSPGQDSCVEGGQDSRRRQCIADDQPSTANGSGGAEFSRVSEQQASVAASCREDADRGTLFPRYRGKGALGPSEVTAPLPSGSASDPAGSAAIHARRVIPSEDAGGGTGECRGPYDRRQSSAVRLSVFEQEPSLFVIDVEQVSSLRETTLNAFWTQISDADEFPAVAEPGGCARSAWPSTERLKAPGDAQAATCPFSHRQRTLDFQTSPRPPYESQARDAVAFLLTHQSCILYQSNQRRRLAELFAECIVVQVFGAALGPKPTGREGATFGPSTPLRVFDLFRLCGHSRPAGAGVVLSQGQAPASSRLEHSRALRAAPAGDPRLGSGSPGVALSSSGDIVLVGGEARSHGSPETGDSKKTPAQAEAVEPITSNRNRREGPKQKEEDVGGLLSSAAPLDWRVVSSKVVTLLNEFFPSGCFTNTPVPHVQSSTSLQEKANVCTPGRARCVAQENEMPVTESIQEEDLLSVCWDLLLSDLQSVNITVPSPVASSAAGSSCPGSVSATVGGIPPLGGQSRTLAAEESLDSHRVLAGGFLWDGLVQTVARRGAGACAFQTREQAQRVAGEITRVAAALRGMSCFERMPRQDGLPDGSAWYDRQVSEAWRQQRELISLLQHLMSTSAGSRSAPLEARALTRKTDDDSSYPLQGLRSGIGSLWTGPGKQPASETALAVSPHSAAGNDACHLALTAAEGEDSTAKGGRNAFVCLRDEERPGWRHAEISRNQSRLLQFHNQDQRAVTAAVRSTPAEGLLWLAASVWTAALAGLTVERPRPPASTAGLSKCSPEFSSRSLSSTVSATAGGAEPSSPHSDFCYGTVTRPHNSISVSVDPASADLQISAHSAPTSDDLLAAAYAALALLRAFTSTQLGQGAIGLALPAWLWFLIIPQSLRQVGFYFHPEGIPMCGATSLLTQSAWSFETIELGLERITDWVPAAWLTMCNSVLSSQLGLVADLETTAEHLTAGEPVTAVRDIPAADLDAPRSYNVSAYWGTLPTTAYPKGAYAHRCLPVLQEIHRETVVVSAFLSRFVHLGCPVLTSPSAALSVGSRPLLFSAVIAGRLHTGQAGASAAMTAVHAAVVAIASSRRGARAGVRESEGKAEGFSKLMQSIFCRPGFAASSLPDLYLLDSFSGKGLFLHEKGGSRSASAEKLFSTAAENGASGEEAFVASTVVTTWTHLLRRVASSCEAASGFFLVHVAGRSGRHRSWGGVLSELPVQSSTSGPSNSLAAVEVLFLLCLKGLQDPRASRVLASVGDAARGQTSTGVWSLPGGCAGPGSSAGLASCCQGAVGDLVFPPLMPSCLSPQHPHAFFLPPPGQAKGARCKGSSGRRKGGDLASSEWGDCSRERLERSGKRCSGAADAWLSGLKSKAADPAAGARTLLCLLEDGWLAAAGLFRSDLKDQGETLAAADLAASCCACMLCYWLRDRHSAVAWTLGSLISFLQRPPHELYVSTCNCPLHRMHPGLGLGARQPLRVWLTDGDEAATSTALADVSHPFAEGRELQQQVSPLNLTMSSRRPVAGGGGTPETYSNCNSDILFRGDGDRGVAVVTGTNSPFLSSAVASLGTRGGECRSKLNSGTGVLQFAEANGDSDRGHGSTNCSSASGTGGITVTQSAKGPGYGGCAPCRPGEGLTPLTATDVDAVSTHTRSYVSVGVCSLPVPVSDRRWEEQNEEGMTRARLLAASQSLLYLLGFCPDSAACMSYTFAGQSHERGEPCTGTLNEPWCDTSEHERESAPQAPASSLGSERGGRPHSSKAARKRRTRERREGSQGSGDWTGGGRGGSFQSGAISGLPRSFPVLLLRALLADEVERLAAWKRVRTAAPSQSGITRLITRGGPARAGLRGSDSRGKPRATEAHGARRGEASGARKDGELDEEEAATSSSGEDEQEQDGIEKASGQKRRPGRAFFPFARGQNICDKYASGDLAGENVARLAGDESFSSSRQKKVPGPLLSKLPIVGRFFKKTGRNVALSSAKRCSKRQSRSGTSSKKSNYEKRECRGRGGGRSMASLDALLSGADLPLIAAAAQRLQWSPEILRKSAYVRQLLGRRGRGSRLLTFLLQHPTSKRNSSESIWRLLVRFDGFMPTLVLPSPSSSSLSCFSAFLSIRRPTSLPVLPSVSWDIFIYSFRLPLASTLQFLAPQTAVSAAFVANHLVASSAADENYCSHHPPSAASPFFSPSAVGTGAALHASLGTGPLACSSKSALLAAGTFSTLLRTYAARALATYPPAIRGRLLLPQLLQLMRVDVGRLVEAVLLQEGSGAQDAQANTGLPEMLQLSTEGALGNADCFPRKCLSLQAALLEALPSDRRELLSRQYAFWNGLAELSGKARDVPRTDRARFLHAHVNSLVERVDLEGITMPLDPSRSIERVLGDDATPLQSAAKVPYALTFETRSTAGTQASVAGAGGSQLRAASVRVTCIFKMFDDVRQDQLALQIIQVAASVFNRVGIDLWLRPYKVLSMRVASQATPGFAAPCNLDNFVPTEASPEPPAGTGAVGATVSSSSVLYEKKHSKGGHHRDYVFCREDKDPANRRAAQPGIGTSPVSSLSLKRGSRAPTTMQVPRAATTHSQATAASPPLLSLRGACCSAGLRSARVVDKGLAMERNEQKCEKGISRRTRAANEPGGIIELIPHTASRHQIGKKYNCSLPEFFACVFERGENSEGICGFTKTAVGQSATSTTNQLSALQRRILLRSTSNDADREEARQRGWQSASERGAFCPAQVVADGGTRGGDPSRGLSQGIRVTAVNAVGAGNIEASAEETAGTKNEPGRVVEERTSKAGGEPTNVADDPDSGYARATSPNNTEASGLQLRSGATTSFSQTGRASGDIVQGQGSLTRKRRLGYDVAVNNFIKSLAGYAVLSFILQVKDRHNGNLLISYESGRVIHIDFGFIFDISPGHDMHFEKAPFKLTKEMVQLMGGHNRTDAFRRFTDLCVQGYLALREQADLIIALVQTMLHSGLPCFKRQSLDNLKWRFQLQATPQQAAAFMAARVMDAYENFTTKAYDMVQHLQQGIDY